MTWMICKYPHDLGNLHVVLYSMDIWFIMIYQVNISMRICKIVMDYI